jgi:tRNA-5-taurinomethyluridine 2-sulfurtransferase
MKIAVLLSGGVDSSVALNLVKREGRHELTAFYLKIWLEEELAFLGDCPWEEDLLNARAVCEQAGVPLEIISLQSEYQERIVSHVLRELKQGRTPSPDILCNQQIKFGLFFDRIDRSYEKVVTGHYAQVEWRPPWHLLKRSLDPVKDQTYFLYALNQEQLSRIWFPAGPFTKKQVRKMASEFDLPNQQRKDSQGICFLGKIKYPEFVRYHLGEKPGEIIEVETGRKLGEHSGVWFYTVGQRKGLGLGGGPWYVVRKDVPANIVYVSHSDKHLQHARDRFTITDLHWIAESPRPGALQVKVRHSPQIANCQAIPLPDGRWEIVLEEKDEGIAAGQSAILYDGQICLGGGLIE